MDEEKIIKLCMKKATFNKRVLSTDKHIKEF
jgi:hypothetical protein